MEEESRQAWAWCMAGKASPFSRKGSREPWAWPKGCGSGEGQGLKTLSLMAWGAEAKRKRGQTPWICADQVSLLPSMVSDWIKVLFLKFPSQMLVSYCWKCCLECVIFVQVIVHSFTEHITWLICFCSSLGLISLQSLPEYCYQFGVTPMKQRMI